jgi:hypothetical protein
MAQRRVQRLQKLTAIWQLPRSSANLLRRAQKIDGALRFPGYGLPLSFGIDNKRRQPFLLGLHAKDWQSRTLTNREVCMLKLEEDITNKHEWWEKVLNPDIVSKWKQEALQMPWASYQHNGEFTSKMEDVVSANSFD